MAAVAAPKSGALAAAVAMCLLALLLQPCRARPVVVGGSRSSRQVLQSATPSPPSVDVATLPPAAQAAALARLNLMVVSLPTDGGALVHNTQYNGASLRLFAFICTWQMHFFQMPALF